MKVVSLDEMKWLENHRLSSENEAALLNFPLSLKIINLFLVKVTRLKHFKHSTNITDFMRNTIENKVPTYWSNPLHSQISLGKGLQLLF